MGFLMEQAQVEDQKQNDDYRKDPKQNGFPLAVIPENGKQKYSKAWLQNGVLD